MTEEACLDKKIEDTKSIEISNIRPYVLEFSEIKMTKRYFDEYIFLKDLIESLIGEENWLESNDKSASEIPLKIYFSAGFDIGYISTILKLIAKSPYFLKHPKIHINVDNFYVKKIRRVK